MFYVIVLGFQLVTNGVLAGLDIVVYYYYVILGWRLVFAPVEDLLFGFALGRRRWRGGPSGAAAAYSGSRSAGPPRWGRGRIREESGATGAHGAQPRRKPTASRREAGTAARRVKT